MTTPAEVQEFLNDVKQCQEVPFSIGMGVNNYVLTTKERAARDWAAAHGMIEITEDKSSGYLIATLTS